MRILIIEDEKEIADGIEAVLVSESYFVDVAYDGLTGLDSVLSNVYDLIILDIMLPKLNGLDLLRAMRNQGIETPVILLTAKSQVDDKILGLDNGADDYMTKPFDVAELLARIRARTRVTKGANQDKVMCGNVSLNRSTQKLLGISGSVKLGKKEFQLLEYLMINAGQILTKDMLINKVWGLADESEYNNLEVYISFLRKKLKFVKADIEIQTTKGVGYSLEVRQDG